MQSIKFVLLLILIRFCISGKIFGRGSIGDACVDVNNLRGTCNIINTCKHVIELKIGGRPYSRCGFEADKEIVCCAQRNSATHPTERVVFKRKFMKECEQLKTQMFDLDKVVSKLNASSYPDKKTPSECLQHSDPLVVGECEQLKTQTFNLDVVVSKLNAGSYPDNKTTSECLQHSYPLVVGGENANPKEFPHMALLGCKSTNETYHWTCGGSLISSNFILTAAHCLESSTSCNGIHVVRLGDLDIEITSDDARAVDFTIENIFVHPQYNRTLKYNDIALIKLARNVEISAYIRPACLPYSDYSNETQLIITGWGSTLTGGSTTAHLQKANVEQFDHKECNDIFVEDGDESLPAGVKERTQICAGSKQSRKDTCQGDSGGPLQVVHPDFQCLYSIIGITSYGQGCGTPEVPAIYTRVYFYNNWIESVVWN